MDAWVLDIGPQGSTTYWVTRDAPYFVKAVARAVNGSTNTFDILSWKPLE